MMKVYMNFPSISTNAASLVWYLGVPTVAGVIIFKICNNVISRRRRTTLQGKVVVITGASSGLGEALAHVFYEAGCKVVLAARRKLELERVKNDLTNKNLSTPTLEPLVLELDLAQYGEIDIFVQRIYDACGPIDILINNGGISHRGSVLHTKTEVDIKTMTVNYFGTVALTKACLPKMVERKAGHIVFISSVQGLIAIPDRSAYAASKHAMQAFGDSLRSEIHQHNIHVTLVSPGYVKTAISINAFSGSGAPHGRMDSTTASGYSSEYVASRIIDAIVGKQKELIVSQCFPRLAIFLRHTAPSLYFWIMAKRAEKTTL